MKDENQIELLKSDFVYSPLIVLSIQQHAERYNENKIPNETVYDISYRHLQNLGIFADEEDNYTGYAAGLNIYDLIYEDSIKKLEKTGIIEIEDEKLLLTESGLRVYDMLMDKLQKISAVDVLKFFSDEISKFNEKVDLQAEKVAKERKELITSLRKIGGQMDQHFPNYLSRFEKQLLCYIYNNKGDELTKDGIQKFISLMKLKCHKNTPYNTLKNLEKKGFVKNCGEGLIRYKLTKLGKAQAKWYAGREIS